MASQEAIEQARLENQLADEELLDVHEGVEEPLSKVRRYGGIALYTGCLTLATIAGVAGTVLTIELAVGLTGLSPIILILSAMGIGILLFFMGNKTIFNSWLPSIEDIAMAGGGML